MRSIRQLESTPLERVSSLRVPRSRLLRIGEVVLVSAEVAGKEVHH
jgi:hypothetical protein